MVFFCLLKGTQYLRPKKWRYAVRKAKTMAVSSTQGGGGVTLLYVTHATSKLRLVSTRQRRS